jgi:HSP20 family protein
MSPFSLLNPFMVMRRMIDVVDPETENIASSQRTWAPPVEVTRTNGTYVIRTELPGMDLDDVRVEIADNAIVVEGEREFKNEAEKGGVCSSELHYGRFYRAIPLPEGANVDQVDARFDNGMLEIRIPVAEHHNRQIPIQTAAAGSKASAQTRA